MALDFQDVCMRVWTWAHQERYGILRSWPGGGGASGCRSARTGEKENRKSEDKVKPKLNCRMDKVSEKSVGNFSYNKYSKTIAAKKTRKLYSVNGETEEDSSIPGLKLDLALLNAKLKVKKTKKLPSDPAKPAHDEDDGWTTVSKSSSRSGKRISENHAMAHIGDIATDVFQSEDDCCDDLPHSDLCQP